MVIKDNTIKAAKGMWLTNGNTYAKTVVLGVADNTDSWSEITEKEYFALCLAAEE